MTEVMGGIIGISIGIVLIVGIQLACYKLFAWEDYPKATALAMGCVLLGILATIFIMEVT